MFRNTFQSGFLSILYAIGSKPLQIWRKNINNGYVKRITDFEMQSSVIEICGANVSTCFLSCPSNPKQTLGVKMPFLVLLIKYLKKYFTFEVQVIDDKNVKRRFRASNYQSNTRVKPFICTIPMKLDEGIRRIYFTDQLLSSKSIPDEYRAFSNANDDNAEEQYQNQMANDPNAHMMQGEGEEQYQGEYHEENQEEHQVVENNEEHQEEHQEEHVEQNEEPKAEAQQEGNPQENQEQPAQENPPQEEGGNPPAENQGGEAPAEQPAEQ